MPDQLSGIGVSPGYAAGQVYQLKPAPQMPSPAPFTDPQAEADRAAGALGLVAADLSARADAARDATAAEILRAQVMMADDPVLRYAIADAVHAGADAPHAIDQALGAHRQAFAAAGGYLAERVADLDDIRDRAIATCLGQPMPGVPAPGHPFILIARDLAPADTAGLDPDEVLGFITQVGGPTSHSAIVARSLGIPAVVQCAGVLDVSDGVLVSLDGTTGQVLVDVDDETVATTVQLERQRRDKLARSTGPGRTADGHAVPLLANIGTARDLSDPAAPRAEGVGLFRTELLYLDRAEPPSLDEQIATYTGVFALAEGRRIVVRTLDSGADKPVPFLHHEPEPNSALGVRGLRLARRHPEVLSTQLEAIARAAQQTGTEVWVMAPMVATVDEATEFVSRGRAAGLSTVGVMIEIPAAALQAASILAAVDFLSIGTNDLSQYAFAADRECGELAELLDPWQPGLLALISACGTAGAAAAKPVGVCGEAAANAALAPVLVGLGVTSLSMSARAIPAVRESLAGHTHAECREMAQAAMAAPNAVAAREAVTLVRGTTEALSITHA